MENRLKFATMGPDHRPRLMPRSRRWRGSRAVAAARLEQYLSWAGRIAGRSAMGRVAAAWGPAGRTLAMLRQTILNLGGGAWLVAGAPGRLVTVLRQTIVGARVAAQPVPVLAGRAARLDLALRLTLRVEGGRAAGGEREQGRRQAAAGPSSRLVVRLLERVRVVEAGGTPRMAVPVTRRRPVLVLAADGDDEPIVRPARRIAGVQSAAPHAVATGSAHGPAAVPRVLAIARPTVATPPAAAPAPQTSAPRLPRADRDREAPTPAPPAASWLAGPSFAAVPQAVVEQLTDRVVRAIDRRVIAARERFGLGPS
jgi:hypothetical protein